MLYIFYLLSTSHTFRESAFTVGTCLFFYCLTSITMYYCLLNDNTMYLYMVFWSKSSSVQDFFNVLIRVYPIELEQLTSQVTVFTQ
jgi:hypothetical protein